VSDSNRHFVPLAFCDLLVRPFDPDEQCAVAEFGELSSLAATNYRVEVLGRWLASSRDEIVRTYEYCKANIPLWDGGDRRTAFGYIIGLSAETAEKLYIEVDCCGQGLHQWELPIHILESMISVIHSEEEQAVLLGPREESRVSHLGVLSRIFRARGILWKFQLSSSRHHGVVHVACKADKAALGRVYQSWH
jgi:hypothetical protein